MVALEACSVLSVFLGAYFLLCSLGKPVVGLRLN
jgi:hypothetical protein